MMPQSKIYVAGHAGLVGSALVRRLKAGGYWNLLTRSHSMLDLCRQGDVEDFFAAERPEYVFMAAGKVGGILANHSYPGDFIYRNLAMATNVIHAACVHGVKKLMFFGSSCIYPRRTPQPIKEEYLLTGLLESTNEPYAVAKIAGVKMCAAYNRQYGTDFLSVMPTNLYGPGDRYDLNDSHVLPALIRKMHEAKTRGDRTVTLWGTGRARREFLYSDDLADACVWLMERYGTSDVGEVINIGTGRDQTIADLAKLIAEVVGFDGTLVYDASKPDGTPQKRLDVSKCAELGWRAKVALRDGVERTYRDFLARCEPAVASSGAAEAS